MIFDSIFDRTVKAFKQQRMLSRARDLAYGMLSCTGRVTITGMLIAIGKQFVDWTAAYHIFQHSRMNMDRLFEVSTQVCLEQLAPQQLLVAHMDDTILRKTGHKIPGTGWRRDPLSPAFHTNFIWAQRFIQLSLSLYDPQIQHSQARAIPVDFHPAPGMQKLKKNASSLERAVWLGQQKQSKMSTQGLERIKLLRSRLNEQGAADRQLYLSVDGSYTNTTILKGLPARVVLIGRVRKDAAFHYEPASSRTKGRNLCYGQLAPTPEQIQQDATFKWQEVTGWAAGKKHDFRVKVVKSLKWRKAGKDCTFQLVIIAPLRYQLKKNGRTLYRMPAYLMCTDNELDIETLLQAYLWRWEIEVNFRDEKTVCGCGDAQVHNEESAVKVPQFVVATHAFIHLADHILKRKNLTLHLPKAKWEKKSKQQGRSSTNTLLNLFRGHYMFEKLGKSFSDFVQKQHLITTSKNPTPQALSPFFNIRK